MRTPPPLPAHIEAALVCLLAYLYADEQQHYEAEGGPHHIFQALRTIADWLGWEPE